MAAKRGDSDRRLDGARSREHAPEPDAGTSDLPPRFTKTDQKPKRGKGSVLTARITAETRQGLEAEAERTGRSISQVAERWIEVGMSGTAFEAEVLGRPEVAPALRAMAGIAHMVINTFGSPTEHIEARDIILESWRTIAKSMLPQPPPTEAELAILQASLALKRAIENAEDVKFHQAAYDTLKSNYFRERRSIAKSSGGFMEAIFLRNMLDAELDADQRQAAEELRELR